MIRLLAYAMSLFTNKQLKWAWSQIIKGCKFVTSAEFEAYGSYLSTIINDSNIFSIEFLLPVLNSPETAVQYSTTVQQLHYMYVIQKLAAQSLHYRRAIRLNGLLASCP